MLALNSQFTAWRFQPQCSPLFRLSTGIVGRWRHCPRCRPQIAEVLSLWFPPDVTIHATCPTTYADVLLRRGRHLHWDESALRNCQSTGIVPIILLSDPTKTVRADASLAAYLVGTEVFVIDSVLELPVIGDCLRNFAQRCVVLCSLAAAASVGVSVVSKIGRRYQLPTLRQLPLCEVSGRNSSVFW